MDAPQSRIRQGVQYEYNNYRCTDGESTQGDNMNGSHRKTRAALLVLMMIGSVAALSVVAVSPAAGLSANDTVSSPGDATIVADSADSDTDAVHTVRLITDSNSFNDGDDIDTIDIDYGSNNDGVGLGSLSTNNVDDNSAEVDVFIDGTEVTDGSATVSTDDTANTVTIANLDSSAAGTGTDLTNNNVNITVELGLTETINNPSSNIDTSIDVTDTGTGGSADTQTFSSVTLGIDEGPIEVDSGGTTSFFNTFDKAIENGATSDGDTVTVKEDLLLSHPGISSANVQNNNVVIQGDGSNPRIDIDESRTGFGSGDYVITVGSNDGVEISGLTFSGNDDNGLSGVDATGSSTGITISSNTFDTFTDSHVIEYDGSGDVTITSNTLTSNNAVTTAAIDVGTDGTVTVSENSIDNALGGNNDVILAGTSGGSQVTVFNNSITLGNAANAINIDDTGGSTDINISADSSNPAEIGGNTGASNAVIITDTSGTSGNLLIDGIRVFEVGTGIDLAANDHSITGDITLTNLNLTKAAENSDGAILIDATDNDNLGNLVVNNTLVETVNNGPAIEIDDQTGDPEVSQLTLENINVTSASGLVAIDITDNNDFNADSVTLNDLEFNTVGDGLNIGNILTNKAELKVQNIVADDVTNNFLIKLGDSNARDANVTNLSVTNLDATAIDVDNAAGSGDGDVIIQDATASGADAGTVISVNNGPSGNVDISGITADNVTTIADIDNGATSAVGSDLTIQDVDAVDLETGAEAIITDNNPRDLTVDNITIDGFSNNGIGINGLEDDPSATLSITEVSLNDSSGDGINVNLPSQGEISSLTLDADVSNTATGITLDLNGATLPTVPAFDSINATDNTGDGLSIDNFVINDDLTIGSSGTQLNISGNGANGISVGSSVNVNTLGVTNVLADANSNDAINVNPSSISTVEVSNLEASDTDDGVVVSGGPATVNVTDSTFDGQGTDAVRVGNDNSNAFSVNIDNTVMNGSSNAGVKLDTDLQSSLNVTNSEITEAGSFGIQAIVDNDLVNTNINQNTFTTQAGDTSGIEFEGLTGSSNVNATLNFYGDVTGPNVDREGGSGNLLAGNLRFADGVNITSTSDPDGSLSITPFVDSNDNPVFGFEGVVNDDGGSPLSNTEVTLNYAAQNQDIDNQFTFTTSGSGEYVAVISEHQTSDFYDVSANTQGFAESDTQQVTIDGSGTSGAFIASGTNLNLNSGAALEGFVNNASGEQLQSTGNLQLIDASNDEVLVDGFSTNASGGFTVSLTPDTYDLRVNHPNFDSSNTVEGVELQSGNTTTLATNFTLREDTTADLTATVEFSNETAIENTDVTFSGSGGVPSSNDASLPVTQTTNSSGIVQFEIPASDTNDAYTITADSANFSNASTGVSPAPGDSVSRDFSLEEAQAQEPSVSVNFTDQTVPNGTEEVTVNSANFTRADGSAGDYVVVVHVVNATKFDRGIDNSISAPVGASENLSNGAESITVDLNSSAAFEGDDALDTLSENVTLRTMLHTTDNDTAFGTRLGNAIDGIEPGDETDDANITISEDTFVEPAPGTDAESPPQDSDGDGKFEDVNGDNATNFDDVVALAFVLTEKDDLTQQQRDAFDINDDGVVNFDDVVRLAFPGQ
ncbi:EF-hand domain-containing protein [Haloquadratum walsbyi]|uniref:Probable pectate lyase C n=1 Tax=Haloquadratum walsbyi (strain DSM 16790 / HBSQ001) TaxID=362976 RepID=Q18KV7_HALWD|nr:EF-hand domain-containing protein [Haloquadratum walsbyi]CAJ51334.1 probable secreted glycoprotein [Haloquadratum walsbyi DSM 16790]